MSKKSMFFLRSFCVILFALSSFAVQAQVISAYTFSQQVSNTYVPLTDSTIIANGPSLVNQTYPVSLPFGFNFDNTIYNDIRVAVNGYISMGTSNPGTGNWMIASAGTGIRYISVFDMNLASSTTANSEISYRVYGTAPNRIFAIQWKNMALQGSTDLLANFQLRLLEGTNIIEMVYGNCTLAGWGDNYSLQIGLRGLSNTQFHTREGYSGTWYNTSQGDNAADDMVYQSSANPTPGITFIFTPPPACAAPSAQPTSLVLNPGVNNTAISYTASIPAPSRYLIVRTPGSDLLTTLPVDGTTYTSGMTLGNGTVVYAGIATSYNNTGLTQLTGYRYTVFPYNNNVCLGGPVPLYNTWMPLTGTVTTEGPKTYTWQPVTGSQSWTTAANWSPARNTPLSQDTLVFSNGGTVTATNVPTQTMNGLLVTGNTDLTLTTTSTSTTLTENYFIRVDTGAKLRLSSQAIKMVMGNGSNKKVDIFGDLTVEGGCALEPGAGTVTVNGNMTLQGSGKYAALNTTGNFNGKVWIRNTANFNAGKGTSTFADTLRLSDNATFSAVAATAAQPTQVTINKVLQLQGSSVFSHAAFDTTTINGKVHMTGSSAYNVAFGTTRLYDTVSLYDTANFNIAGGRTEVNAVINNHGPQAKFMVTGSSANPCLFESGSIYNHMRDGGNIPVATFLPGSLVNITGVTATGPTFNGSCYNLIWNCPGQSASVMTLGNFGGTTNNLSVLNTGSYSLSLRGAVNVGGNYNQENSTLVLQYVQSGAYSYTLNIAGTANLTSGVFDILSGPNSVAYSLTVKGAVNQGPGFHITNSGSGAGNVWIGGSTQQTLNMNGTYGTGRVNYYLNNPAGAILNGNIQVSSGAAHTIYSGNWSGSGSFVYNPVNTLLSYQLSPSDYSCAVQEWPAVNGPASVTVNNAGFYPGNFVYMPPGNRTIGALTLTKGVLVLGNSDLTLTGTLTAAVPGFNRMVATNGNGKLVMKVPEVLTGSATVSFPLGDITGNPEYSPVDLLVTGNAQTRLIGARVVNSAYSQDTATNGLARHWIFSDDGASTALNYKATFSFPTTTTSLSSQSLYRWSGTIWNAMSTVNLGSATDLKLSTADTLNAPAQHPLHNAVITAMGASVTNVYTWNGSVSKDYWTPQNWTPARNTPGAADVLQFNNGQTDTLINVATDNISRMAVSNNTSVTLETINSSTTQELVLNSDLNAATNELSVDSGSTLSLKATNNIFTLKFFGDSGRALIAGTIRVNAGQGQSRVNILGAGSKLVVSPAGKIINASAPGGLSDVSFVVADSNRIEIYGNYEHQYTTVAGYIPFARWMDGSVCSIKGYTTSKSGPYVAYSSGAPNANFYRLIYDCPQQTDTVSLRIRFVIVRDSFIVRSAGSGVLDFTNDFRFTLNHYLQSAGNILFSNAATGPITGAMSVAGSFTQSGGSIKSPILNAQWVPTLSFNGTSGVQQVSFWNSAPTGAIKYEMNNPDGIHLVGTGLLTTQFRIDSFGGLNIAQAINHPILTTLKFVYQDKTTLSFSGFGNIDVDTLIFPALNGPSDLYVNVGLNNSARLPGSRTLSRSLSFNSGSLILDTAHLTLGASATMPGNLNLYNGFNSFIRLSGGTFTRWFNTTALTTPYSAGTPYAPTAFYPICDSIGNRSIAFYFSTTSAIASGGTITVGLSSDAGYTSGLTVVDGAFTINKRSNASWTFSSGNGFALASSTMGLRAFTGGLFSVNNPATLRFMKGNAVSGNHLTGGGTIPDYYAERNGLTLADINNGPYYIGSDNTNLGTQFNSVTDGNWNNAATWDQNAVPGPADIVNIRAGDTVTVNTPDSARGVNIYPMGTLLATSATLYVDSFVLNKGLTLLSGATVNLGPAGGGKRSFGNYGTLNMMSGTLNVNGNLALYELSSTDYSYLQSTFLQSGGTINIDGNAGGVAANSVPATTPILHFEPYFCKLSGGTIRIIDPHAAAGTTSTAVTVAYPNYYYDSLSKAHQFVLGDGISTDPGGSNYGFLLNGSPILTTLTVNGSPSGANRHVMIFAGDNCHLLGDVNVYGAGQALTLSGQINVHGNITGHAGTQMALSTAQLSFVVNATNFPGGAQSVGGAGTYTSGLGYAISRIGVDNPSGVTFDIGDFTTGGVIFQKGILTMANGTSL
ncbi:MAG: hypothetical protein EOP49_01745, partial [Sphingobacteriales bacterium]